MKDGKIITDAKGKKTYLAFVKGDMIDDAVEQFTAEDGMNQSVMPDVLVTAKKRKAYKIDEILSQLKKPNARIEDGSGLAPNADANAPIDERFPSVRINKLGELEEDYLLYQPISELQATGKKVEAVENYSVTLMVLPSSEYGLYYDAETLVRKTIPALRKKREGFIFPETIPFRYVDPNASEKSATTMPVAPSDENVTWWSTFKSHELTEVSTATMGMIGEFGTIKGDFVPHKKKKKGKKGKAKKETNTSNPSMEGVMRLITRGDNSAPSYGFKPYSVKDYGFYGAMGAMITEQYLDKDRRDNVNAYAVLSDPTGRNIAVYFIEGFKKKCQAIADNGRKTISPDEGGRSRNDDGRNRGDEGELEGSYDSAYDPRLDRYIMTHKGAEKIHQKVAYSALTGTSILKDHLAPYAENRTATTHKGKEHTQYYHNMAKFLKMKGNPNFYGVNSIMNPYSVIRLYGSLDVDTGGKIRSVRLLDKHKRKAWYDLNTNTNGEDFKLSVPTTTNIIKYGQADAVGRVPYSFQDFIFCKFWNVIPNNHLITLRRYSEPTRDNLTFPDLDGKLLGVDSDVEVLNKNGLTHSPIATMLTYFGEGTSNDLPSIINFSSGYKWKETKSEIWDVTSGSTGGGFMGNMFSGNEFSFGGGSLWKKGLMGAEILSGLLTDPTYSMKINPEQLIGANGMPDPYTQGPWNNRIQGPLNRISSVMMRDEGMTFGGSGKTISLSFHYVARNFGGANPKAVMLDILANALAMGTGSALFFKGAHRYAFDPTLMPSGSFLDKLYKLLEGNDFEKIIEAIAQLFVGGGGIQTFMDKLFSGAKELVGSAVNFGKDAIGVGDEEAKQKENGMMVKLQNQLKNLTNTDAGRKKLKDILYALVGKEFGFQWLTGRKALLMGDPVGDWHLTIGNPMNPIAMIGNLICSGVDIKFGNEMGWDDFPTEMTVTINLQHAMDRDMDGISSIFNRGAGRIYVLPDWARTSADRVTKVDKYWQANSDGVGPRAIEGWGTFDPETRGLIPRRDFKDEKQNPRVGKRADVSIGGDNVDVPVNSGDSTILAIPRYTPIAYSNREDIGIDFGNFSRSTLEARSSYYIDLDKLAERANKT